MSPFLRWTSFTAIALLLGVLVPFLWDEARLTVPPVLAIAGAGWVLLNIRRHAEASSFVAVLLVAAYPMFVYVVRPMYLILKPRAFRGFGMYTDHGLNDAVATALVTALVGTVCLFSGWQLHRRRWIEDNEAIQHATLRRLYALCLILVVSFSAHLLVTPLGGFQRALGLIRVSRVEMQGNFYPLIGVVGVTAIVLHAVTVATRDHRRKKGVATALCALLVFSVMPSIIIGSRGFAFPPIIAAFVIVSSRLQLNRSVTTKLAIGGIGLLAAIVLFGAAKNTADVASSADLSSWIAHTAAGVESSDVVAQVDEFDFFVAAVHTREELPSRLDLLGRVVRFPLTLLPSSFGLPKPESYGLELRTVALGQVVPTGVPAGLIGELWLIGSLPLVALGMAFAGWGFAQATDIVRSGSPTKATFGAIVLGHLPLLMARPLILSLGHLLAYGAVLTVLSRWPSMALVQSRTKLT